MEIKVKLLKSTVEKSTKIIPHHLTTESITFTVGTYGSGYLNRHRDHFLGLHYEKHNRKVISTKKVKKIFEGKEVKTTVRRYKAAYWKVTYYKIPIEVLKAANIKFIQYSRNFYFGPKTK